jgi:glycosyltransferase involved in cell wall biosynthesis
MERARAAGARVGLDVVTRPGDEPPGPLPGWLRIHRGSAAEIHALLPDVMATVIPRPRSAYNDLALPVKLYEYLSYGRPLLVTDCTEQARVVADAGAGIVTPDEPTAMADAIGRMAGAGRAQLDEWSMRAHVAARAASWERRAAHIVELFGP